MTEVSSISGDRPPRAPEAPTASDGGPADATRPPSPAWASPAPTLATRTVATLTLLVLAPFVGEYLLGNVAVQELPALPLLALLYGGGALLVREVAVRRGLDWIGVLLLGAAYGLVEAGLVDQSLFSPDFEGMTFQETTPIPLLGISAHNALGFVAGHAIWSIGLPIVLTGLLFPATRGRPLTGPAGLALVVATYLAGCWLVFDHMLGTEGFMASPRQRLGALAGALLLIGLALRRVGPGSGPALRPPAPLWVGFLSFVAFGVYMQLPETWLGVGLMLAWLAAAAWLGPRLARHPRWTASHNLAVAAGALLTFAWLGFVLSSILDPDDQVRRLGNAAFAFIAVLLLLLARRRLRRPGQAGRDRPAAPGP